MMLGRTQLRTLALGLTVAAVAGGVAVVIAELGLRLFAPLPYGVDANASAVNHIQVRQTIPGVKPMILYERNEFGLRSTSMKTLEKPPQTLRVLCIGASTTDQAVQETPDTWCGKLEPLLADKFRDRKLAIQTAAYGRGGVTITVLQRWARTELARLQPDVVVVLMGVNDVTWRGQPDDELLMGHPTKETATVKLSLAGRCVKHFQLCRRAAVLKDRMKLAAQVRAGKVLEWHSENLPRLREAYRQYALVEQPESRDEDHAVFESGMEALVQTIRGAGAQAVLLGQPSIWKDSMTTEEMNVLWFPLRMGNTYVRATPQWFQSEMHRYNEITRKVAARDSAAYLDLEPLIPKRLDVFFDDCHYTDLGNVLMAEAVAPVVTAALEKKIAPRDFSRGGGRGSFLEMQRDPTRDIAQNFRPHLRRRQ